MGCACQPRCTLIPDERCQIGALSFMSDESG